MKPCSFSLFTKNASEHVKDIEFITSSLTKAGFTKVERNAELTLVMGGDGSILKAFGIRHQRGDFLMINYGHLGYFSDYREDEIKEIVHDILTKEPIKERLPLLATKINGYPYRFVQDCLVLSERTLEIEVLVNERLFTRTRATGIVVGTPIGSSAYLYSLGGPMILPSNNIYEYQIIAPVHNRLFSNTISSAILSRNDKLKLNFLSGRGVCYTDGMRIGEMSGNSLSFTFEPESSLNLIHFRPVNNLDRILLSQGVEEKNND